MPSNPEDIIPGFSTFIYSEMRFREPHEYINYYKWELDEENEYKETIEKLENEIDILKETIDNKDNVISSQHDVLISRDKTTTQLNFKLKNQINRNNRVLEISKTLENNLIHNKLLLLEYGTHKPECNKIQMSSIGRSKGKCTCKWEEIAKDSMNWGEKEQNNTGL